MSNVAKQQAREKTRAALEAGGIPSSRAAGLTPPDNNGADEETNSGGSVISPNGIKLATASDFLEAYKTAFYKFSNGLTVQFQALTPGDILIIEGAPLTHRMTEAGLNIRDKETRDKFSSQLSMAAMEEMGLEVARRGVCMAVISVNFVMRRQEDCPADSVSIHLLSPIDVTALWLEILAFSGVRRDEVIFPGDSEEDETAETAVTERSEPDDDREGGAATSSADG